MAKCPKCGSPYVFVKVPVWFYHSHEEGLLGPSEEMDPENSDIDNGAEVRCAVKECDYKGRYNEFKDANNNEVN